MPDAPVTVIGDAAEVRAMLRAYSRWQRSTSDKTLTSELRKTARKRVSGIVEDAKGRAVGVSPQAAMAARPLRAASDRMPTIKGTGSTRLRRWSDDRGGQPPRFGDVFYGAEYGSNTLRQFRPWRGNGNRAGYFYWPAVRAGVTRLYREYLGDLQRLADRWAREGSTHG